MRLLFLTLALCLITAPAYADCTDPPGVESEMLYNADYKTPQFCDGTDWWSMKGGGSASLPSCADGEVLYASGGGWDCGAAGGSSGNMCGGVGGLCADGTIYAGVSLDGRVPLYTTAADAGTFTWGPTGDNTTMTNCSSGAQASCWTGEANTDLLAALPSAYNAADHCANLTAHGQTDWYLPAEDEVVVLYTNRVPIGAFQSAYYWSSSEYGSNEALAYNFSDGLQYDDSKSSVYRVRCVRR